MFCMHCGKTLPSDAFFCPNCGQKAEASSDAPAASAPVQVDCADDGVSDEIESSMNFALIITVLALFNCGSLLNLVLGIAAIAYANKGSRNLESGDAEKAKECAKTAKTLCLIATGIIVFQVFAILFVISLMIVFYLLPFFFIQ